MDVLNKIKKLQQERGWSNYRLAHEVGIAEGSINNMFRLNNIPTISTLETLCRGFGITLAQFFTESGDPVELTPEQTEMLDVWNALSENQKRALLTLFRTM
jgi:transcriptional regulator with XRE-family HTH domain